MEYMAKNTFLHDQLGRIEKGEVFSAEESQLHTVREFIEPYETKVVRETPADPAEEPAKRGRPKKSD